MRDSIPLRPSVAAAAEHVLTKLGERPGDFVPLDALQLALDSGLPSSVFVEAIDALASGGRIRVRCGPRLAACVVLP